MAIFSVSDLVIATTLIINAVALLSPAILSKTKSTPGGLLDPNTSSTPPDEANTDVYSKFAALLSALRQYSCILAFWNIIFILLMFLVFD